MTASRYDVVVVGAGPAGSVAAREAAASGASTLLLERSPVVGEPVRCGEFLPSEAEILHICDERPPMDLFDLPRSLVGAVIEGARAYPPSGKPYALGFSGYTIWRNRLDQYLAQRAMEEEATLWTETAFLGIEDGRLLTSRGPITAQVVIGADGPHSAVGKAHGFPAHEVLFPALSLAVRGRFDPVFEAFFGGKAPGGYAWIIPRQDDANVGLGVKPSMRETSLQETLTEFLSWRGLEAEETPTGGYVPMSGPLPVTTRGNVLLAGDAAGQVLATSGGGIFTAMVGGYYAGRTAGEFLRGKAPLSAYEGRWRRCMGGALDRARALFGILTPAFDDPESLEEIFRLLGPEGLLAALRCQEAALDPLSLERPRPT